MKTWTGVMFQIARKTYTLPLQGWLEDKSRQVLRQRLLLSFSRRPKARIPEVRIVATPSSASYSGKSKLSSCSLQRNQIQVLLYCHSSFATLKYIM